MLQNDSQWQGFKTCPRPKLGINHYNSQISPKDMVVFLKGEITPIYIIHIWITISQVALMIITVITNIYTF